MAYISNGDSDEFIIEPQRQLCHGNMRIDQEASIIALINGCIALIQSPLLTMTIKYFQSPRIDAGCSQFGAEVAIS